MCADAARYWGPPASRVFVLDNFRCRTGTPSECQEARSRSSAPKVARKSNQVERAPEGCYADISVYTSRSAAATLPHPQLAAWDSIAICRRPSRNGRRLHTWRLKVLTEADSSPATAEPRHSRMMNRRLPSGALDAARMTIVAWPCKLCIVFTVSGSRPVTPHARTSASVRSLSKKSLSA